MQLCFWVGRLANIGFANGGANARITDDCELVRICGLELGSGGAGSGSQVAGDRESKSSPAALPTAKCGANGANSDRLRIGANCESPTQLCFRASACKAVGSTLCGLSVGHQTQHRVPYKHSTCTQQATHGYTREKCINNPAGPHQ